MVRGDSRYLSLLNPNITSDKIQNSRSVAAKTIIKHQLNQATKQTKLYGCYSSTFTANSTTNLSTIPPSNFKQLWSGSSSNETPYIAMHLSIFYQEILEHLQQVFTMRTKSKINQGLCKIEQNEQQDQNIFNIETYWIISLRVENFPL